MRPGLRPLTWPPSLEPTKPRPFETRTASQDMTTETWTKVFEIYIADRKATTHIQIKLFLLRCVNPAARPLVHCYLIRLPRRVASWVNYSSRRTESSSEHFISDLSLLKADALWCENKRCSDSNPWPMDPKASVLPTTSQRLTSPQDLDPSRPGPHPETISSISRPFETRTEPRDLTTETWTHET